MENMAQQELKLKTAESEKITINLGPIDLGQIDLLVQEGFYSNRTDLIRTAIRNQLNQHADVVKQTVARKSLVLGMQHYSREDLERIQAAGQRLQIQVLGLAIAGGGRGNAGGEECRQEAEGERAEGSEGHRRNGVSQNGGM